MCAKFQPDSDIEEIGRPQSLPSTNHSSNPPRVTLTLPETPPRGSTSRKFHVEVKPPRLSPSQMKQYKHSNESSLKEDPITRVDEVIGEYEQDGHLYYFARYQGGIARKFSAGLFQQRYESLVDEYSQKKLQGTLQPFDPSATYIHPLSRVKAKFGTSSTRSSVLGYSDGPEVGEKSGEEPDTAESIESDEESEDEEEDDEDYDGPQTRAQPRRAVRASSRQELPYSPRKLRQVVVLDSDNSGNSSGESEIETNTRNLRRSTRSKKRTTIRVASDVDDYVDEDENDMYDNKKRGGKASKKKGHRPKSALPMYGRFRDISTITEDPLSDDDDNEVLRRHRSICEKCHLAPAHKLLADFKRKKSKGKKRKRSTDDEFEESDDEDHFIKMGGWVQCLRCPVGAHWKCLASTQRDEVLKAVRQRDQEQWEATQKNGGDASTPPKKRNELSIDQTTEFICGACMRGGICMGCMETALLPDASRVKCSDALKDQSEDIAMTDGTSSESSPDLKDIHSLAKELLFRCFTCKRLAHYRHLPRPSVFGDEGEPDLPDVAEYYQGTKNWLCSDCSSFRYDLDKIIAWRPYPTNAVEPSRKPGEVPDHKSPLPREYLVKWAGRSYRRVQWVPHMWLVSTNPAKLKNFIVGGTKVELLPEPAETPEIKMDIDDGDRPALLEKPVQSRSSSVRLDERVSGFTPLPDAELRIPVQWKTVDRVLDVLLWQPTLKKWKPRPKRKQIQKVLLTSEDEEDERDEIDNEKNLTFEKGEQPPGHLTETFKDWQKHDTLRKKDIGRVAWAFIKWDDLGYDETTWDSPPRPDEPGYAAFVTAFERFIDSQTVFVPKQDKAYWKAFDNRSEDEYRKKYLLKDAADLDLDQAPNLKLLPFQVDGFNWLCNNWWNHQHCILADEMGLGKTVQVATFLGNIITNWNALPALVVVPNSTITNWVREFERWAPQLRVVPFNGDKAARDVIKDYELFHKPPPAGKTPAKFHVLVTTYETLTGAKDFTPIFKNQQRWEVLVVDEGQRLKSDNSLLFKKLNELNTAHRIIMTGTPLNNNMRELFNLMNFLDPEQWNDLAALEKQHEVLDEELVKQLHARLRPYFLRRIKSEVLQLPPKNEVIVPVSMAPLQREVYRSILSNNLNILNGLAQPSFGQIAPAKSRINNVLMHLRKCLQHPYLYAEDIEPRNLPPQETHEKLIDASAKLRFLKTLLPKLKERGHRVLLFSQFVIALNVIEDFLQGEGYKFLRLDGNTKGSVRQKSMDEFNKPGSEYFVFLLTTRAGGVGINLYTADTVIIYDPDFNPHQDLQAIARAYRFGQKKTCMVFKLVVKDSAEERIMQIGKKKLVLDHLIVQKMDDDDENGGENVQSILTYGAQALFDSDKDIRDITYTDNDVEKLLEKTAKEAVQEAPSAGGGPSFSFAKIWAADKDTLEEVVEDDQQDSWAQTLQKINQEREKQQQSEIALSGRGARRKAADIAKTKMNVDEEEPSRSQIMDAKARQKSKSNASEGSAYFGSDHDGSINSDSDIDDHIDDDFVMNVDSGRPQGKSKQDNDLYSIQAVEIDGAVPCGLCGQNHAGVCPVTDSSEYLAEYREMLILHADDEPWEERSAAVQAIDETLYRRGHLSLIAGQPLHPLPKPVIAPSVSKKIKISGTDAASATSSNQKARSKPQKNHGSQQAQAGSSKHVSSSHTTRHGQNLP